MRLEIENKPFTQFILILSLCLISFILFSIIGTLAAALIYDFNPILIHNLKNYNVIEGLKMIQLFSALGLFVVPPLIYSITTSTQPFQKLGLKSAQKPINYILILVLMIVIMPFIEWTIELNATMVLPGFMTEIEQWMRNSEQNAAQLTKLFLTFNSIGSLFYILLIVAVVPAIGEELLFRGVLQKIAIKWSKNVHLGIWISAILFSALHLQFFGFFPRLLLGVLFGYVFYWSKSLWIPILGHFINNGAVVMVIYFYPEHLNEIDIPMLEGGENAIFLTIGSFSITAIVLFLFWKINQSIKKE